MASRNCSTCSQQSAQADWEGVDYSKIVLDPSTPSQQDYVVFTYDDFQSGQASGPYPKPPNHVVSIRVAFDKRTARASTNKFDNESLKRTVQTASVIGRQFALCLGRNSTSIRSKPTAQRHCYGRCRSTMSKPSSFSHVHGQVSTRRIRTV